MFFDKLWVRIKGDLLIMKDDLTAGKNLRERAVILLARLEDLLKSGEDKDAEKKARSKEPSVSEPESQRTVVEPGESNRAALQDLSREWKELQRLREETQEDSKNSELPPPNPRKLG